MAGIRRHVGAAVVVGVCVVGALGGGAVAGAQRAGDDGEPFTIYSSLPLQGDSRPQSADVTRAMRMALRDNGGRPAGIASSTSRSTTLPRRPASGCPSGSP